MSRLAAQRAMERQMDYAARQAAQQAEVERYAAEHGIREPDVVPDYRGYLPPADQVAAMGADSFVHLARNGDLLGLPKEVTYGWNDPASPLDPLGTPQPLGVRANPPPPAPTSSKKVREWLDEPDVIWS